MRLRSPGRVLGAFSFCGGVAAPSPGTPNRNDKCDGGNVCSARGSGLYTWCVRHCLRIIGIAVGLGVGTTLVVAAYGAWHSRGGGRWSGVAFTDYSCGRSIPVDPTTNIRSIEVERREYFASVCCRLSYSREVWGGAEQLTSGTLARATAPFEPSVAAPGAIEGRLLPETDDRIVVTSFAAGWPLVCMEGRYYLVVRPPNRDRSRLDGVVFVTPAYTPLAKDWPTPWWALPVRPMLWRFLANSVVFGGAWWLLLAGVGKALRSRRIRRGECLSCGYDMRGIGKETRCPECGAGREGNGSSREGRKPAEAG